MHSSIWLSALILVPLLGAVGSMLARKVPGRSYLVAVGTSVVEMVLALVVWCSARSIATLVC